MKSTCTTNALDNTEDHLIKREAGDSWEEMDMRKVVDTAVVDVEARYHDGQVPWTYKAIRKEITPYPSKNCFDVIKLGQEDEATAGPDGFPWDAEEAATELGGDDDADEKIEDFCPEDWVDGAEAASTYGVAADKVAQHHGDGGKDLETCDLGRSSA